MDHKKGRPVGGPAAASDDSEVSAPRARYEVADHAQSAATLRTIAETVQRIMHADTTSVAGFSLAEQTVTWRATSGFTGAGGKEANIVMPLGGNFLEHAIEASEPMIINGIGVVDQYPAEMFPMHSSAGVRDIAVAPLSARGEVLGALVVGYRSEHQFTTDEIKLLDGLAEMAALALDHARLFETVETAKRIWERTVDAIPDGIIVHDDQMRIVRCNAHAAEMMDMQPPEAIGLTCADAFARLFGERAAAYHMGQGVGTASSFELQAEDGRRYLVSVAPLEESGSQPASVITWSDVTELADMQEQLARSRRLATVGQLAAGVAHEINNPLATITTCAEATLRKFRKSGEAPTRAEESHDWTFYLEEIVRQALRCKEITRGLLDLSRQRRPNRLPCDINDMAAQCVRLAEERIQSDAVSIKINLDTEVGEVATDAGMLRQLLDNLMSNALDAVGEGGEITISTHRVGERVAIEVADSGHGIAPEMLVRIFDPFFTTKDQGKGSGLGLAISYTLAEALGGALTVESKLGAGSRFRLWIPRRLPETTSRGAS
ncbi:MAG: two-component system, NtrC family, sensor kinase [Acidobacteriota bacterium]|jgi:two-component system NtrC family sensor kinase|nr:two-component system, NtrC family, sensor kinase [Acidobacteriota bacterium]